MLVSDFDYSLPDSAIAQSAIEPRDSSRLLDTTTMSDRRFTDLPELVESGDLIVVNTTKVRAARLMGQRTTGGKTEILLTKRIDGERWEALVRPAKKLHAGSVVECGELTATLLSDPIAGIATLTLRSGDDVELAIERAGTMPLPPYFHGTLDVDDRYQTVFADQLGSSAAPTAALHFTEQLVRRLKSQGVQFAAVDLEVGLDTFRPMTTDRVLDHEIHSERIVLSSDTAAAINATREGGRRVIAIGTTVVRTVESAADADGSVTPFDGTTDLFISPGYEFRAVDALVTNFHAPRTTLLVLISAFLGDRWRDVYDHGLRRGYRFLSFGDAMWIEEAS